MELSNRYYAFVGSLIELVLDYSSVSYLIASFLTGALERVSHLEQVIAQLWNELFAILEGL